MNLILEWEESRQTLCDMALGDSETGRIKPFCVGTHTEKQRLAVKAREEFLPGRGAMAADCPRSFDYTSW